MTESEDEEEPNELKDAYLRIIEACTTILTDGNRPRLTFDQDDKVRKEVEARTQNTMMRLWNKACPYLSTLTGLLTGHNSI